MPVESGLGQGPTVELYVLTLLYYGALFTLLLWQLIHKTAPRTSYIPSFNFHISSLEEPGAIGYRAF